MADFGQMVAAFYFLSYSFVTIPLLGLISGALAGRFMRGVSTVLGAIVGLVTGLLVLAAFLLPGWISYDLFTVGLPHNMLLLVAYSPPVLALTVPVAVLQVIRIRRSRGN